MVTGKVKWFDATKGFGSLLQTMAVKMCLHITLVLLATDTKL